MASGVTALFVGLFVVVMAWVGIATAVAVGVERGLKRYQGEFESIVQSSSDPQ